NPCLRLNNWGGMPGLVFANNAVYCESGNFKVSGLDGVVVTGNVVFPAPSQLPRTGYRVGRAGGLDFVQVTDRNVYPTADAALIHAGNIAYATAVDFNHTPRTGTPDAGAYAWIGGEKPGWKVIPGFKGGGG